MTPVTDVERARAETAGLALTRARWYIAKVMIFYSALLFLFWTGYRRPEEQWQFYIQFWLYIVLHVSVLGALLVVWFLQRLNTTEVCLRHTLLIAASAIVIFLGFSGQTLLVRINAAFTKIN